MEDTIAAISTALGVGAISIIRVSGPEAVAIVNHIFKGKNLENVPTHTIHYGKIVDLQEIIDEVLVTVMKSPKTFTTEDVVEINCHGGINTTKKVLELLYRTGCRPAEPGEFTKRAFLNGRIDLTQAEGVMDLISSKTDMARKLALNELSGKVSSMISKLREKLVDVLANIEVNIDYPEYEDTPIVTNHAIKKTIHDIYIEIQNILRESENGKLIQEGITTSIIGRPNVGKSSLLNQLLEEEKAIVTDIAGTTRDTVEGTVVLDGIILNIIDTAGIRKTDDIIEAIGVKRSLEYLEKADLVLFVLNYNEPMNQEEEELLKKIQQKNYLLIINKIDLEKKLDITPFDQDRLIFMSMKENKGLDELKQKIKRLFQMEDLETKDLTYLTNTRSLAILKQCLQKLEKIEQALQTEIPIDMVEIDIKDVWNSLGQIIGETYEDELIDQMFQRFCLGK